MNPNDYISFEERVERYKKWSVEELAKELAYRDLAELQPVIRPVVSNEVLYDATPNTTPTNPFNPPFYTTCSCKCDHETTKQNC